MSEPDNVCCKKSALEDMPVVSIGTGTSPQPNGTRQPDDMNLLFNAATIPSTAMFAAVNKQDFLCRVFGHCFIGDPLNPELGDMIGKTGPSERKHFTYVHFNPGLTRDGLQSLGLNSIEPEAVPKMDPVAHEDDLRRLGEAVAKAKVKVAHFENVLRL